MPRVNKASSRPQAEAQTHPHSPKPKKAPTPTTAVTVQQPEPQSGTEHQLPVNTTTSTSKMTKSKVQSAKLASTILSHIVPASTPNDMNEKTKFHGPRTLHWETLENLNVHTQFSEWLTPVWRRFFDLRRPVYKKLIFEFFSTYRFNKQTTKTATDTAASSMSFSLRGKTFNLSFKEFGVAMNLYTKEEVEGEDFGSGLIGWPSDVSMGEFWSTFGAGQYQKNLSCTAITKPSYRILHRLISESINQRGSCTNLVTQEDMFYMFCIVNNRPCNLAKCLARYLYKSVGKSEASAVCGGAYISQLAVGLGVYKEEELDAMEQLASTGLFDETQLRRLEIVEKSPPLRFVDPSKASANDAPKKDTTDAALSCRLDAVERELHWVSSGLHFLIHKLGHSFAPPPHVKAHVPASHQHTSAAPDTANAASSSSCPSQSF